MSTCRRSAEKLFTVLDLQQQNTCLHSCCRSVWQHTSLMWQNTAASRHCTALQIFIFSCNKLQEESTVNSAVNNCREYGGP